MGRYGAGFALVTGLLATQAGCYYDQWQAEQRANRILREDLARVQDDLQNEQYMNRQKDTTIDGLNKQLASKNEYINSLTAENGGLREQLSRAQEILEKMAGKGPGPVTIVRQALPPALDAKLKELAEAHPDSIEYIAEKGAVRWKADLLFPSGSDRLMSESDAMTALQEFASICASPAAAGFDVIVVGHTDNVPVEKPETLVHHKTNWHLSAHRAISVMTILDDVVSPTRLGIMGYGEFRPIADNTTEAGKAKNRRVEVYLVPKSSVQTVSRGVFKVDGTGLAFLRVMDQAEEAQPGG